MVQHVKELRLDRVEAFELCVVEGLEGGVRKGRGGKGCNVGKIGVRKVAIWKKEVLK
jgi:hypothetical protein